MKRQLTKRRGRAGGGNKTLCMSSALSSLRAGSEITYFIDFSPEPCEGFIKAVCRLTGREMTSSGCQGLAESHAVPMWSPCLNPGLSAPQTPSEGSVHAAAFTGMWWRQGDSRSAY